MTAITQKAMLARLHISQWSARKNDKKVTEKVERDFEAVGSGRFNKILVAEEAVREVSKTANAARTFHYENTLPWGDDGSRILPAKNYMAYTGEMRSLKSAFESSVQVFLGSYQALVADSKERLKGMFNEKDYPEISKISEKYAFDVEIDPLPDEADFRVTLQEEEVEAIRRDIKKRSDIAYEEAMKDLWQRLYKGVSHMAEKLKDADGVFRNSLVNNLCDLCSILPRLNLSNSKELEEMRRKVEEELCRFDPEILRTDKVRRSEVAGQAASILDAMKGYMGNG
jgi:hypothetical protein